jgi:hypothetical protein
MQQKNPANGVASRQRLHGIAAAARRRLRNRPQAKARAAGSHTTDNMLASFGMVVGLLTVWALAVNM